MTDAESLAVDAVLDALTREGPHPEAHRAALYQLARQWPTLSRALRQLADARGVALPTPTPLPLTADRFFGL